MKKLILALSLLMGWCASAFALDSVFQFNTISNNMVTGNFYPVNASSPGNSTYNNMRLVIAYPIKLSNLSITLATAPDNGAGTQSWAATVFVNGSSTALTCTVSEASKTCTDSTDVISLVRGDTVAVKMVSAGTPLNSTMSGYIKKTVVDDNRIDPIGYPTNTGTLATGATNYFSLFSKGITATENQTQFVIPVAGIIRNMYVLLSTNPGGGKSYAITLRDNAVDTLLTCTVSGASATSCQDMAHPISVAAGDLISISSVPSGTPTAASISVGAIFESSNPNVFIMSTCTSSGTLSNSVTNYLSTQSAAVAVTTNLNAALFPANYYINSLAAHVFTAPNNGAGTQSYTFTVRDQTNGNNSLGTCAISETSTDCTHTTPLTALTASDFIIGTQVVPSGTPSVTQVSVGISFTDQAPSPALVKHATVKNATIKGWK